MSWSEVKYAVNSTLGTDRFIALNDQIQNRQIHIQNGVHGRINKSIAYDARIDIDRATSNSQIFYVLNCYNKIVFIHKKGGYSHYYWAITEYDLISNNTRVLTSESEDNSTTYLCSKVKDCCYCPSNDKVYVLNTDMQVRCVYAFSTVIATLSNAIIFCLTNDNIIYYINTSNKLIKISISEGTINTVELGSVPAPSPTLSVTSSNGNKSHWLYKNEWFYFATTGNLMKIDLSEGAAANTNINVTGNKHILTEPDSNYAYILINGYRINQRIDILNDELITLPTTITLSLPAEALDEYEKNYTTGVNLPGFASGFIVLTNVHCPNNGSYYYFNLRKWDLLQSMFGEDRIFIFIKKGQKIITDGLITICFTATLKMKTFLVPLSGYVVEDDAWIISEGKYMNIEEV